jgi:hypothetical protein
MTWKKKGSAKLLERSLRFGGFTHVAQDPPCLRHWIVLLFWG